MNILFLVLFLSGWLLAIVGSVLFIIAAFRVSIVWGLCVLFLGPAGLVFLIMHWEEAKKPLGIQLLGILLAFAGMFTTLGNGASGMSDITQKLESYGVTAQLTEKLESTVIDPMQKEIGEKAAEKTEPEGLPVEESDILSADNPKSFEGVDLNTVREELGHPKGILKTGDEVWLQYDKFTIYSADGVTASHVEVESKAAKKGALLSRKKAVRSASTAKETQVRMIANGGKKVDIKKIVTPGKITVIDFYADWCGPCRHMGPQLEQIARSDSDVTLCKIDIVNWKTPVVKQYGIRSIPNVRVYNRKGVAVGTPSSNLNEIKSNIERAR